ncbi:MAG: hypothetical protein J0I09_09055 [Sphingobacteriia bacterium]|nr:hypothetical protein [Sphingobacteriia bacterium]
MKKIFFLLFAMMGYQLSVNAQSDKYVSSMGATLQQFAEAKDENAYTAAAAKFERIADAEKTQWLPYYYAALVKARMAQQKMGGDPDKVSDDAQVLLDKATALSPANSEIFCVKYIILSAKLMVDPQSRYMKYMGEMSSTIESAKKTDPTNPRPYTLQAIGLKYTPESFGGGCNTARPMAQKAVELYGSFKPASPLHPNWGKETVDAIIADCNK